MTDQTTNAAGTPLVLHGTPSATGGPVTIDFSGVPVGIDGKEYSSDEIVALDAGARQGLFERLLAKYEGVGVDEGNGTAVYSAGFDMTPADAAVYEQLIGLGAVVPPPMAAPAAPPASTAPVPAASSPIADPAHAAVPVTHEEVAAVPPATPAAMTQKSAPDTHVTVHNDSVSLLRRAWADVVAGVEDAEHLFERALHHVFPSAR